MDKTEGQLAVSSENIFPIIRQWLYSEKDIFLRELVSNAADALSKRLHLQNLGLVPQTESELAIKLDFRAAEGILTIADNGIGMSMEEVDKYINTIAYSGLLDFVDKYHKDSNPQTAVIGHFGLGFYSAFMIAQTVEIDSLSCQENTKAAHWQSEEGIDYTLEQGSKEDVGTTITLHLSSEGRKEYDATHLQDLLSKYCAFLPWPIYWRSSPESEYKRVSESSVLWQKTAKELTATEYCDFYRKHFGESHDPLFWIHLNLDYPFKLQGVLFFPRADLRYQSLEGRIRIYSKQVYVADNVREMLPDFLFLLQGMLDCPDLPLNVSRSYLQDDAYVKTLSSHIVKKVADKLLEQFKEDRQGYEANWQYLALFFKYGMLRNQQFAEKTRPILLFADVAKKYHTIDELAAAPHYYTQGEKSLLPYIRFHQNRGHQVLLMEDSLDKQLLNYLEENSQGKMKFLRVDAKLDTEDNANDTVSTRLGQIFSSFIAELPSRLERRSLGADNLPLLIIESEEARRIRDYREEMLPNLTEEQSALLTQLESEQASARILVFNADSKLPEAIAQLSESAEPQLQAKAKSLGLHAYRLAQLAQNSIGKDDLAQFLNDTGKILTEYAQIQ